MRLLIEETETTLTADLLVDQLRRRDARAGGIVLLQSAQGGDAGDARSPVEREQSRFSFVAADPFLVFRSCGSRCETVFRGISAGRGGAVRVQFGNPWRALDALVARYELLDEIYLPFPLGGCFGYWGYDLKNFVEPKLPRRASNDLELPDCHVGFYDSLVVFDHELGKTWIVSTGLGADASRSEQRAADRMRWWRERLIPEVTIAAEATQRRATNPSVTSNWSRAEFIDAVRQAQAYIRSGDIYQVNLAQRLTAPLPGSSWELFRRLSAVSPAPFAAFVDCGEFQIVSSSPERFLRLSGPHIQTRPIKGTRPRSVDATRDVQLSYELQTSAKEMAELVMITDLLRNDLGKVCEFGSVQVPELARLERFAQVQHLVSTVEGRLRPTETHFSAFASCFPGGSITGAPKFRAMEIIDELEPIARGPYTGAIGYLGFNRESELSITIRTALCREDRAHFHVGAGIVADSDPEAEYEETLAKAAGFVAAMSGGRAETGTGNDSRGASWSAPVLWRF